MRLMRFGRKQVSLNVKKGRVGVIPTAQGALSPPVLRFHGDVWQKSTFSAFNGGVGKTNTPFFWVVIVYCHLCPKEGGGCFCWVRRREG